MPSGKPPRKGERDRRQPHRDEERHADQERGEPDRQDLQHQGGHSGWLPGSADVASPRHDIADLGQRLQDQREPASGMTM
jgi:hypothetical protein